MIGGVTWPALFADTVQDLRASTRAAVRNPGFTLAAALVLACGIALSVAIFSIADVVLRRPLPVANEDALVALWGDAPGSLRTLPLTPAHFERYRREARTLVEVAASVGLDAWPQAVRDGDRTFRAGISPVTGNFFQVLGSHPHLGRMLTPDDDRSGSPPVAVISDSLWRGVFAGDSAVLGRRFALTNSRVFSIVGVAPAGLDYPSGTEVWIPFATFRVPEATPVGRLRPGLSASAAAAELRESFRQDTAHEILSAGATAAPLRSVVVGDLAPTVRLLTACAALLLVTACLNVVSMFLVRGLARHHEVAVRRALGARRSRVVRQLLLENAPIALAAAGLGVWFASSLLRVLVALAPANTPRLDEVRMHGISLPLAAFVTCVAVFAAGLLPALWLSGDSASSWHDSPRTSTGTRGASRLQKAFVVCQVALAVVVLFAAGLLGRSLAHLQTIPMGLAANDVAVVELSWPQQKFSRPEQVRAFYDRLMPSIAALPGVASAAPVNVVPFTGVTGGWDGRFVVEAHPDRSPVLTLLVVGAHYFETAGITLRSGRTFRDSDRKGATPVAIVSEQAARSLWSGEEPVGKRIRIADSGFDWRVVVGVAAETRYRALREAAPTVYLPMEQFPEVLPLISTLIVRTHGMSTAGASIRNAVRHADEDVDVLEVSGIAERIAGQLATPRLTALLVSLFGAGALLLVAAGLYAALAGTVRARRRELAIRHAVGATPGQLRAIVLAQSLAMCAVGVTLGLAVALGSGRLLESVIYDVPVSDPRTALQVVAALGGVALLASYIPARRATEADAIELLRQE
jgi:putative ABC transport system permease protein